MTYRGPCGVLDYRNVMPTMDRVVTCKSCCEELGASAFGIARNGHSLNEMVENQVE